MAVSTETKLAAVHGYVEAFAQGDPEMAVALFAEDAVVEDPVGTPPKNGHDEIRAFYTGSMATGAKLELTGAPRSAGDAIAFAFAVNLDFGGSRSCIEVIDVFRFDDTGKIIEMRAYWGPENMRAL